MNEENSIRVIAFCLFIHDNKLLLSKGYDHTTNEYFYRPLGGGIEYKEKAIDAVKRELKEEIGAEIIDLHFLGVLENIFTYKSIDRHEIHFAYLGKLKNNNLYELNYINGVEENGKFFVAEWILINNFASGKFILYPKGTLELLQNHLK